jgi:2-acylglycerol O-acyltransferase 2
LDAFTASNTLKRPVEADVDVCVCAARRPPPARNLLKWKAAQRWTYKRFGFPMPFLPGGWKGFLPLPAPLPLSFVVGGPVAVPPPGPDGRAAEADVEAVSRLYYRQIEGLFARYKASSGFPHLTLVLKHD